jgi:hypothetical protein
MTTKHTPGPWGVVPNRPTEVRQKDENGAARLRLVADCTTVVASHYQQSLANARLIAAAPDLADALAWALEQIEDDLCPDHAPAIGHARAVLARARGEGVQS